MLIILLLLVSHLVSGQQTGDLDELDSLLQDYAFRAFVNPRTGTVYQAQPPSNLTGIQVSALRLRSGSLWRRGVTGYHEFNIPVGVNVHPYVERLALVYQNLGNWSNFYYRLPSGYTFLVPVVALLAYDATNVSALNLPLLQIHSSNQPIWITFSDLVIPHGFSSLCAHFTSNGSVEITDLVNPNTCATYTQGHFSIVTNSSLPSPPPPPPPPPAPTPSVHQTGNNRRLWIIIGSVIGGLALLILLAITITLLVGCMRRKKIQQMEAASEGGVPLPMTIIGTTKAPVAEETRTRPAIETEFVP